MSAYAPTYRFNVAEYQRLGETGILHEDDRVELLNGEIIVMSPIGYRHVLALRRLTEIFYEARQRRYDIDTQCPFVLDDGSEPQPDLALLRRETITPSALPRAEDVLLIVEISDASLGYDRAEKLPAYARNGIAEAWIVNLVENTIEVYRQPNSAGYGTMLCHERGDSASPLCFPDIEVRTSDVISSG